MLNYIFWMKWKGFSKIYAWSLNAAEFCTGKWIFKEKSIHLFYRFFTLFGNFKCTVWVSSHRISPYLFQESFEWILAQPSTDFESSAFWIRFSDTGISILHVCSQCIHHMGQGYSDDPQLLLWIIILHWDLSPCSLYCRTARLLWIKDLPLSFRISVRTGLKSSAAVKVCHNKEAWLNKRNLPLGRILQLFIKEKVKHNT